MREISYHKDYRHNYLIIREDEMTGDDYQRKMITENRIRGLLPCQIRYINGETLLYYEITSKQSVKGLFEGKHLTMKELENGDGGDSFFSAAGGWTADRTGYDLYRAGKR